MMRVNWNIVDARIENITMLHDLLQPYVEARNTAEVKRHYSAMQEEMKKLGEQLEKWPPVQPAPKVGKFSREQISRVVANVKEGRSGTQSFLNRCNEEVLDVIEQLADLSKAIYEEMKSKRRILPPVMPNVSIIAESPRVTCSVCKTETHIGFDPDNAKLCCPYCGSWKIANNLLLGKD